jgi:hypothetical protein
MFQINLQLGFRPKPAGLEFHKLYRQPEEQITTARALPVGEPV